MLLCFYLPKVGLDMLTAVHFHSAGSSVFNQLEVDLTILPNLLCRCDKH